MNMTINEVEIGILAHLETINELPAVAYPNRAVDPQYQTYIEYRNSPNEFVDDVLNGGCEYFTGIALVTIVAPVDRFTTESNQWADAIRAKFPKALRIATENGMILIDRPVSVAAGFAQDGFWRLPVNIYYQTEPSNG